MRADSPEGEEKNSQEQGSEKQWCDEDAAEGSMGKPAAEPELTGSTVHMKV